MVRRLAVAGDAAGLAAPLTRPVASVLVSELYTQGAARLDADVVRTFETTNHWRFRARLVPFENDVVVGMERLQRYTHANSKFERYARVEWQPWRFGSRRPWVLC